MPVKLPSPIERGQAMIYLKARRMKGGMDIPLKKYWHRCRFTNDPMTSDAVSASRGKKKINYSHDTMSFGKNPESNIRC
jgi:hypothetical protein